MLNYVLWMAGLFISSLCFAIQESEFPQKFEQELVPYFEKNGESRFMTAKDGKRIHFRSFTKPGQSKALIILPGRTESTFKWAEVLWDLKDLNLAVYIIDHRGQGASDRLLDDPQIQYIEYFDQYVEDLQQFMIEVIKPLGYTEVQALSHSMGANILALHSARYPQDIQKLILSSPMLDITAGPFLSDRVAHFVLEAFVFFGKKKSYVFGGGPWDKNESYRGTASEIRYQAFHKLRVAYSKEVVGSSSFHWVAEAYEATWNMRKVSDSLLQPILMFQAGRDEVVMVKGQDYVCERARQCRKVVLPESQHETHIEADVTRNVWIKEIRDFLSGKAA